MPRRSQRPASTLAHTDPEADVWSELGGYRLLRTIGSSERGATYLAVGDAGQVVIKAYRDHVDSRLAGEVACLTAVETSPHIVELVDVAVEAERPPCVILERLEGQTLTSWLRERTEVDQGEAVTLGVSVVRAVRAVHAAGWTHGDVSPANIRFDGNGCPVLLGFGRAVPATPARIASDWSGAASVVDQVLRRTATIEPQSVEWIVDALRAVSGSAGSEAQAVCKVEEALFSLGLAGPIVASSMPTTPGRPSPQGTPEMLNAMNTDEDAAGLRASGGRLAAAALAAMEDGVAPIVRAGLRRLFRSRKRPILVGLAAAVALTATILLVLPQPSAGHAQAPDPQRSASATEPARSTSSHTRAATAQPSARPSVDADEDPVSAAVRMFVLRERCLARADAGCLAGVDQDGSPALAADREVISAGGASIDAPDASRLSLVESMGDAAVIAVAPSPSGTTKPASALLIRTEAGWRLRALFEN